MQKEQYLQQVQATMTQFAEIAERAAVLAEVFIDREHDAAAANPILLTDLDPFGLEVYHLGVAVNVLQDLARLRRGEAVAANAAYRAVVNKWRSLP